MKKKKPLICSLPICSLNMVPISPGADASGKHHAPPAVVKQRRGSWVLTRTRLHVVDCATGLFRNCHCTCCAQHFAENQILTAPDGGPRGSRFPSPLPLHTRPNTKTGTSPDILWGLVFSANKKEHACAQKSQLTLPASACRSRRLHPRQWLHRRTHQIRAHVDRWKSH